MRHVSFGSSLVSLFSALLICIPFNVPTPAMPIMLTKLNTNKRGTRTIGQIVRDREKKKRAATLEGGLSTPGLIRRRRRRRQEEVDGEGAGDEAWGTEYALSDFLLSYLAFAQIMHPLQHLRPNTETVKIQLKGHLLSTPCPLLPRNQNPLSEVLSPLPHQGPHPPPPLYPRPTARRPPVSLTLFHAVRKGKGKKRSRSTSTGGRNAKRSCIGTGTQSHSRSQSQSHSRLNSQLHYTSSVIF
jgi:hypothetical protein